MKLTLGLIGALVIVSTSFIVYHQVTNKTIITLRENAVKLEQAVSIQEQTIKQLEDKFERQQTLSGELQNSLARAEEDKNRVVSLLRKHNLEKILKSRPAEAERAINDNTKKVFRQLEADTSSNSP